MEAKGKIDQKEDQMKIDQKLREKELELKEEQMKLDRKRLEKELPSYDRTN